MKEVRKSGSAGWHHTEDSKRKMRESREKAKERRESMDTSDKWTERLLLRGASPQTIAELSDSSDEEDEKKKKSILFARELLSEGLISEDLTSWRFLDLHYRNNKRSSSVSFFDMLRVEVFYKGIQEAKRGDLTLINLYRSIGYMVDPEGFETSLADEEDFVSSIIDEKPEGVGVDSSGYYNEDGDGNRWRQPVVSGNGVLTVDSPRHSVSRRIRRDLVKRGRELVK